MRMGGGFSPYIRSFPRVGDRPSDRPDSVGTSLDAGSHNDCAGLSARTTSGTESSPLGCSKRAKLDPAPHTRHDPRHTCGTTNACHGGVPGRGSLRRRRQRLREPDQGSTLRVARQTKRSADWLRVAPCRVLGDYSAGRSPNQSPRPLQSVRKPIAGCRHAMGAINVQSQMLAAPTAVMAEQAIIGLVEHPEQPMTISIANPGCRHKLWVPLANLRCQSQRSPSPAGESAFPPTSRHSLRRWAI